MITLEKNIEIALFMDFKRCYDGIYRIAMNEEHPDEYQAYKGSSANLRFHDKWDWIMPAAHKAYDIEQNDQSYYYEQAWSNIETALMNVDIDHLHLSVYEFAKLYNKTQNLLNKTS